MTAAAQPRTVVVDIIGTTFSLARAGEALRAAGAAPGLLERWFAQGLRDSFAWSHAGGYVPLRDVLEAALARALESDGHDAGAETVGGVMRSLGELEPNKGAAEACAALVDAGFTLIALTNGSEDFTRGLLARAGLLERFSLLLSCDAIATTKPHPAVYAMVRDHVEGDPWMLAAHAWDIAGAHRAGYRTAYVSALETRYLDVFPTPDVTASSLREAAERIIAATS